MNLTPNFTLEEFVRTSHRNIDNDLPHDLYGNATRTCEMLERIRSFLSELAGRDIPITISSGYRCLKLNEAVGSKSTSDHVRAFAADWTAKAFGTPYEVCKALEPNVTKLGIGQLIHEFGSWIHTGVPVPINAVNRIITISKSGTEVGVQVIR